MNHQIRVLALAACMFLGLGASSHAVDYSLAGDFTYAENNADSLWSFRMDDYANNPPTFLPLLDDTSRDAATLWGTPFETSPMMWSEGGGFWGIGKNTTGVEQTANGVTWAPDEVLLHPKGGASPARLVIAWTAPRSMVVNVHYSFRKAMPCGNGVGYELRTRVGGVDTELVGFNNIGESITRDQLGLAFEAGDQMFFRIDTWGAAGCDITGAAIEITEAAGGPLSIDTDPTGGTVAEGGNFTFNVAATGATGYAWYKDDILITGAGSAAYQVIDAKPIDAGTYTVVAMNPSQSVTSAPAVLTVTARPTYATVVFAEDFNAYTGNQNALQFQTGLKVSHSGNLPGWGKSGGGAIHAVDRTGAGNYAAMIWQDNVLTVANGLAGNEADETYYVDFVAAPATYSEGSQATAETDGIVVDVLRGDNSVLASFTCMPGAWGTQSFTPFSFQYVGDGSGDVRLRVGPLAASGHFGGSIDNLRVSTDFVPSNPPEITLEPEGGTVDEGSDFTFNVIGSGLPTYEWRKDDLPIPGATAPSYSIVDARPSHSGTYTVVLSNAAGSVTSAPALFNVNPWPVYGSYLEAILTDNPIHYYPLDETEGNVAADLGSLALVGGTYLGGFTLGEPSVSPDLGSAVRLDGTSGTLVDLGVFHPGDAVSVEAWVWIDTDARAGWNAIVGRWDGSYEIASNSDLGISVAVRNDANALGQVFSATPPARGQWHHIVGIFSEGTLTVYVDGIKGQTQSIPGVLQDAGPTPDRVMIGATRDGTSGTAFNLKGLIDEVAIYDTALTVNQVRAHYRAGQSTPPSLAIHLGPEDTVVVSWPSPSSGYVLQCAEAVTGPYEDYEGSSLPDGDRLTAIVPMNSEQKFFRLFKP